MGLGPAPSPAPLLGKLHDLERRGLRLLALAGARRWLEKYPAAEIAAFARAVASRLLRGPAVELLLDDRAERVLLGAEITVGRSHAALVVPSPLLSRPHLRIARAPVGIVVEDLRSHNGTWLAGARVAAPLPIGGGLDLLLGKEIPCALRPEGDGVAITLGGERTLLPLGALIVPGARIDAEEREGERVVTLDLDAGAQAKLGEAPIAGRIELSRGDAIHFTAPTAWVLRVVA
jgi:pSer/pThr/pTyr-binding forkhead associated (FHA) protein